MRLMLALALLAPSVAHGATEPRQMPSEFRLSDADKEKVLEEAAARQREQAGISADAPGRHIRGEVGVSLGTGGYRSGYGTAYVPVGEDGLAIITVDSTDHRSRRTSVIHRPR